jgi:hypothetical protein
LGVFAPPEVAVSILDATEQSIAAATHLQPTDYGAVAALRELAARIDAGSRDNVAIPTYLKFCESLGLTPAGRLKLAPKKDEGGGKLGQLRAVHGRSA